MIPKIILGRPKLVLDVKCNKCNSYDIAAIPEIKIKCKNCKRSNWKTIGNNIVATYSKQVLQNIRYHNKIILQIEVDDNKTTRPEDIFNPKNARDWGKWTALVAFRDLFEGQNCYEVSDIEHTYDYVSNKYCKICGVCHNCVTCIHCGKKYIPHILKKNMEKRYKCPQCGNKAYKTTFVARFEKKGKKSICAYCGSGDVSSTSVKTSNTKCNRCNNKQFTKPDKTLVYRFTVEREKRAYLKNAEL